MTAGWCFFFQAEDGIRDAQESRGLGDVYKRQVQVGPVFVSNTQRAQSSDVFCAPPAHGIHGVSPAAMLILRKGRQDSIVRHTGEAGHYTDRLTLPDQLIELTAAGQYRVVQVRRKDEVQTLHSRQRSRW